MVYNIYVLTLKGLLMEYRDYIIVTDTTTDMGADYYKENNIPYVALHYIMDDKEYVQYAEDGIDIKTFYDKVRNGSMPKTSQASYEDLFNLFEEIVKEGKNVFYLSFSAALSGSYHTSTLAAGDIMEKYPERKVICVDSAAACGGEGLLLDMCVRKYNDGYSLEKLVSYAEETKYKIAHFVVADDLNHLHRGGRVSKVSAVVGGMLGIKPLIHVNNEGKLIPYGKMRGRKAAIESIAKQMKKKYIPGANEEIFINHADCLEDAEYLGNYVKKLMPDVKRVRYGDIGAVIGSHTGAGTLAIFFVADNRDPVAL